MNERLVSPEAAPADAEPSLRPQRLAEFIGQTQLCQNLRVFIEAARQRREALDHVLLAGPPGLGKTTLAQIIAVELGVGFRLTSGPVIVRAGDLAAQLTNLQPRDVLFIDEIHRLAPAVEEILYPALEEFQLDLMIGEGPAARSVRIDLPPFTLIGATTRTGLLTTPLRDRFGILSRLHFYDHAELEAIVVRGAAIVSLPLTRDGAVEIARRARGTPRVARPAAAPGARLRHRRRQRQGRRRSRRSRAHPARGRPPRPGQPGPALSQVHRRKLRRRPGRRRHAGGGAVRAARHARGGGRALPAPAGAVAAHAARPPADPARLAASRPRAAARRRGADRAVRR